MFILLLPSVHVYEFFYGYHFRVSQCLSECCPSGTTVDKESTTGEEKAAGYSQRTLLNVVNVKPASYIIIQFFENCFTFNL